MLCQDKLHRHQSYTICTPWPKDKVSEPCVQLLSSLNPSASRTDQCTDAHQEIRYCRQAWDGGQFKINRLWQTCRSKYSGVYMFTTTPSYISVAPLLPRSSPRDPKRIFGWTLIRESTVPFTCFPMKWLLQLINTVLLAMSFLIFRPLHVVSKPSQRSPINSTGQLYSFHLFYTPCCLFSSLTPTKLLKLYVYSVSTFTFHLSISSSAGSQFHITPLK